MCAHNLNLVQSLREREARSGAANQLRDLSSLGSVEGSVCAQGVQSDCAPLLFGDSSFNITFNKKLLH